MTAKKVTLTVFDLNAALAKAVQDTIPPATMKKLDGAQSNQILNACADCASDVLDAINGKPGKDGE